MLLTEYSEAELLPLLSDSDWVAEQKHDGTRALIVLSGDAEPQALTRKGGTLGHTAATQHLGPIFDALHTMHRLLTAGQKIVLDGEIMIDSGQYRVWDIAAMVNPAGRDIIQHLPWEHRRAWLEKFYDNGWMTDDDEDVVVVTYAAHDEQAKRDLLQAAHRMGVEGLVFKHRESPYVEGQRSDHWRKLKFTYTADVVVHKVNRGRNDEGREVGNIAFGMPDGTILGACSAIGKPHVEVGQVIEVKYLYFTGASVIQPRMERVREDKQPEDVDMDQFRPYTKEEIAL